MEMILQDLRYAIRTLWKSRAFAAVAIVTLALGIGASTAIFSVIENILIAPFPYPDSSRLMYMSIHNTQNSEPGGRAGYSSSEFLDYAAQNHVFDRVTAASEEEVLYKHGEGTERIYGADVTPGTFEFFGLPALYGRVAQPADYEPGAPPVFVMRYKTWVSRFNGDLGILNKTLVLNGIPRTLIGIMPPRFAWYEADVLFPTTPKPGAQTASGYSKSWFLLGHLKPGVTVKQAEADLAIIASREAKISPQDYPTRFTVQVRSLTDNVTGRFQSMLLTALAGVALLLLIGCGNVANLMLARATGRKKEFALRRGSGRESFAPGPPAPARKSAFGHWRRCARDPDRLGQLEINRRLAPARHHPRRIDHPPEYSGPRFPAPWRRGFDCTHFRLGTRSTSLAPRSQRSIARFRQGRERRFPPWPSARRRRRSSSKLRSR